MSSFASSTLARVGRLRRPLRHEPSSQAAARRLPRAARAPPAARSSPASARARRRASCRRRGLDGRRGRRLGDERRRGDVDADRPGTERRRRTDQSLCTRSVAAGDGAVWLTYPSSDTVSRIDPATNKVTASIHVGPQPAEIAISPGAVWVADAGGPSVSRIDPATNRVVATIHVGPKRACCAEHMSLTASGGKFGSLSRTRTRSFASIRQRTTSSQRSSSRTRRARS